jgi:hypothetical protein
MATEEKLTLIQSIRERRLVTLGLADQAGSDRWREPLLPGGVTAHAMFSHLLAWDEWAIAVFELSALRELPEKLTRALREIDGFNARAVARYNGLAREDLLMGLQGSSARLASAATGIGGEAWAERRIPDLAPNRASDPAAPPSREPNVTSLLNASDPAGQPSRGPSVGGLLKILREHEREHDEEFSAAFGVSVDLEKLRADALNEEKNTQF